MTSKATELKAVMQYLLDRGMPVTTADEPELLARIEGFASASAKQEHKVKSATFYAYRVDLDDYDVHGVFRDGKTSKSPVLCEGTLDEVYRCATLVSMSKPFSYAIFNGNGEVAQMLDRSDISLAVYTVTEDLNNPDAQKVWDVSGKAASVSSGVYRWPHIAQDLAKARHLLRHSVPTYSAGTALILVAVLHTGEILWRQSI